MSARGRQSRPAHRKERFHDPDFPEFRRRRSHRIGFPDDCDIRTSKRRSLDAESTRQGPDITASRRLITAPNHPEMTGMVQNKAAHNPEN